MNFCLRYWCQAAQQLPCSQTLIRALRTVFGASLCSTDVPAEHLASAGKNNVPQQS